MAEDIAHANAADNLAEGLRARLPAESWTISPGHPLELSDGFLPRPDLAVARGSRSNYRRARPRVADAVMVAEIANTSWYYDSGEHLQRYALEGIPLYWIVHLKGRRVEVYSQPDRLAGRYRSQASYKLDQAVPLMLGDLAFEPIAVDAILRDSIEG